MSTRIKWQEHAIPSDAGHGSPLQGRTRQKWLNMQDRFQHTSAQRTTTQTNAV
jgi:hypothetical protein